MEVLKDKELINENKNITVLIITDYFDIVSFEDLKNILSDKHILDLDINFFSYDKIISVVYKKDNKSFKNIKLKMNNDSICNVIFKSSKDKRTEFQGNTFNFIICKCNISDNIYNELLARSIINNANIISIV